LNSPAPTSILPEPFEWIYTPAGKVTLQYPPYKQVKAYEVEVKPFYIAKYPITNAQFAVFVDETGYQTHNQELWQKEPFNRPLHPVIDLRWQEAMRFCSWLSEKTGYLVTLPTDAQWQRAAQGDDNRKYPWGNEWDTNCCNSEASKIGHTTPVTQYPQGASPFGVMDMAGNVFEWCLTDAKMGAHSLNYEIYEIDEVLWWDEQRIFQGSCFNSSPRSVELVQMGAISISFTYLTGIRLVTSESL
jgi:formylglycine-generating enzyme required for sulfatase activity